MALERTQKGFWEEISASEAALRPHLATYEADLLRICGQAYGSARDVIEGDPENHWQEWLAIFLPQLVGGLPHVDVDARESGWPEERAEANQSALNTWGKLIDIKHDIEIGAVDFSVRWCAAIVQPEPVHGMQDAEDPDYMPGISRLSPMDVRWDSTVKDLRKARWISHAFTVDLEDLQQRAKDNPDEGWNLPMIETLLDNGGPDNSSKPFGSQSANPPRKQVKLWNVWDRHHTLPDAPSRKKGYNGTYFTVLDGAHSSGPTAKDESQWIRKPQAAFCRRKGPYAIVGNMLIGDLVAPLAPLVADTPSAVYLNRISRAIMRSVESYKRVGVTTDSTLADKIEWADDQSVFSADGVDVRQVIAQVEMGGINEQLLAAKADALDTLSRRSGVNDVKRGSVTGVGTATEVQGAMLAGNIRSSYPVQKFLGWVTELYEMACFYFDLDPDVVIESEGVKLRGGSPRGKDWNALDHERLALRIDPNSTSMTNEQTKQIRFATETAAVQFVAALPPHVAAAFDLPKFMKHAADASGVRGVEELIDAEVFWEGANAMLGQQFSGEPPTQQPTPRPRFAWNAPGARASASPGKSGGSAPTGRPAQQRGGQAPTASRALSGKSKSPAQPKPAMAKAK